MFWCLPGYRCVNPSVLNRHCMFLSPSWWMISLHPVHVSTRMFSYLLSAPFPCLYCRSSNQLYTTLTSFSWPGLTVRLPTPALASFQCLCRGVIFSWSIFLVHIWALKTALLSYLSPAWLNPAFYALFLHSSFSVWPHRSSRSQSQPSLSCVGQKDSAATQTWASTRQSLGKICSPRQFCCPGKSAGLAAAMPREERGLPQQDPQLVRRRCDSSPPGVSTVAALDGSPGTATGQGLCSTGRTFVFFQHNQMPLLDKRRSWLICTAFIFSHDWNLVYPCALSPAPKHTVFHPMTLIRNTKDSGWIWNCVGIYFKMVLSHFLYSTLRM